MKSLIRDQQDFWTGVIYIAFGLSAIIIGREYELGTATKMGPAYFPSVLGGLLVLIGVIAAIRSFVRKQGEAIGKFAYKQAALILIASVLFGVLVRGAGLVIAIFVLVLMSAFASSRFKWKSTVLLAAGLSVFSVVVFVKALGLPMPILGSWFGG